MISSSAPSSNGNVVPDCALRISTKPMMKGCEMKPESKFPKWSPVHFQIIRLTLAMI